MSEIKSVYIDADVYFACSTQAFFTEKEEVMGLLIGYEDNGVCRICAAAPLARSDKRPDRVEIAPETMISAVTEAEQLAEKEPPPEGKTLTMVGWYHSHPHITVYPSAVDIRTQYQYQQLGNFIGLIFGLFNVENATNLNRVHVIAFVSERNDDGSYKYNTLPVRTIPSQGGMKGSCLDNLSQTIKIIYDEEKSAYALAKQQNDAISLCHNRSVFHKHMCKFLEEATLPMLEFFSNRRCDLMSNS